MSATAANSSKSSTASEDSFTITEVQSHADIQAQPASALIERFGTWDEINEYDGEWDEINGIGAASADALDEAADEFPGADQGDVPAEEEQLSTDTVDDEQEDASGEKEDTEVDDGEEVPDEEAIKDADAGEDAADEETADEADPDKTAAEEETETDAEDTDDKQDLYELSGFPEEFEGAIKQSRVADVVETAKQLVDECKIRFGDDRLSIRAVDPANVAMIDIDLSSRAFGSLSLSRGVIGVNLDRLSSIIDMGSADDMVMFSLDPATRKLHITVDGVEYTMALIDPDSIRQEPEIPALELATTIEGEGSVLRKAVQASDMVSDHMEFDWRSEALEILAEGDSDDINYSLEDEDGVESVETGDSGRAIYSLEYLKSLDKMVPTKKHEISLVMGNEYPLKMRFTAADDHADVEAMVAPRIQSE